jgi:hypothetical protein
MTPEWFANNYFHLPTCAQLVKFDKRVQLRFFRYTIGLGDLAIVAQYDGLNGALGMYRYIGFELDSTGSNDCMGYTSPRSSDFSNCVKVLAGGPVLPTLCPCDVKLALSCCKFA